MRYFLDTEFDENGKAITLISLGIVAEDGRELYVVSSEFDPLACNPWVQQHVLPGLGNRPTLTRDEIRQAVTAFIGNDPEPEFWGYFADYDWVVFCQLWGRMLDIPASYPKLCLDLKQWARHLGVTKPKELIAQISGAHNALEDARWNRDLHHALTMRDISNKAETAFCR